MSSLVHEVNEDHGHVTQDCEDDVLNSAVTEECRSKSSLLSAIDRPTSRTSELLQTLEAGVSSEAPTSKQERPRYVTVFSLAAPA